MEYMHAIEGSILLTSNSVASADYLNVFCGRKRQPLRLSLSLK